MFCLRIYSIATCSDLWLESQLILQCILTFTLNMLPQLSLFLVEFLLHMVEFLEDLSLSSLTLLPLLLYDLS